MAGFLPISREDMEEQGIAQLDFVYVIGDAYAPSVVWPCGDQPCAAGAWVSGGDPGTAGLEGS